MNKKILFLILLGVLTPIAFISAQTLTGMAGSVRDAVSTIGVSIVFIGWVVAGILWLTSAGSPEKTGTAKKAIVACTIGTILVILAAASEAIMNVVKTAFGI